MNRLTYKLDEPIKTTYLNYEYKRIKDYDIDKGNFGRITDDMIFNKLGQLEDIEEKHNISLLDELDKKLTILEIIKKHKLLNYVLKNEKCANMYHLSKEECDLLREIEK